MTGWTVPGSPAGSTSLSPEQQTQFSSWWLNERYQGDFNNVDGLYQNENGYWQGEPGRKYDINPETGQKGQFKYMATPAFSGWMDVTPEKYGEYSNIGGGQVKMIRNRHGLYTPESAYGKEGNWSRQYQFTENPNTGEAGKWIFLGQMGWVNVEGDPQPEPADGTITFGAGGQMAGPYNSARDNPNGDAYATNNPPANNQSAGNASTDTTTNPPANTAPAALERTGMLDPVGSSWLDVMNRRGANIDSWDSYLGMFTNQPRGEMPRWSSLDSNQVQDQFNNLASNGLFTDLTQADVYQNLMKRLGYGA